MLSKGQSKHTDRGSYPLDWLIDFGIPPLYLNSCKKSATDFLTDIQGLPWKGNGVPEAAREAVLEPATIAFVGKDADRRACQQAAFIYNGFRSRAVGEGGSYSIAGPPRGSVSLGTVRAVPIDVLHRLYHPFSPFNGCLPPAGPDEPSGMNVGIGVLAIYGGLNIQQMFMHYPNVVSCLRRRATEGLPTYLGLGEASNDEVATLLSGYDYEFLRVD